MNGAKLNAEKPYSISFPSSSFPTFTATLAVHYSVQDRIRTKTDLDQIGPDRIE